MSIFHFSGENKKKIAKIVHQRFMYDDLLFIYILCVVFQLLRSCIWTFALPLAVNILQQALLL
jgi:hypothetical protein